jgi:arabinofuranosyltransferase
MKEADRRVAIATRVLGFVVVAFFGVVEAWMLRFVQDDAYISWRYADNFARGWGLVWNQGERVEGYTNFLWTLILTIPHVVGIDVETFAIALGLVLFVGTLAIFYAIAGTLLRSWLAAGAATLVLGLFPSFAAFATGGLETQLQTCLVTATSALAVSGIRRERPSALVSTGIGTTAALAMLTRMDSVVLVAPLIALYAGFIVAFHGWRKLPVVAPAIWVPLAICGAWLAWKLVYYQSLLPNSYWVKVEGATGLVREGVRYVRTFVQAYAFYLPLACIPVGGWLAWEGRLDRRIVVMLAVPLGLWLAYVVRVGGDFMEYRFIVPALPLAFLATYWVMCTLDSQPVRAAVLTSIVMAGGMATYSSPTVPKPVGAPLPLEQLAVTPEQEWFEIGTVLGEAFAHSVHPTIAVVPSGVIPYRSRLPSVDMLGLNDREVRNFLYFPDQLVGHRYLAPLDLLMRRRVHFLIAHPVVRVRLAPDVRYRFAQFAQRPAAYADEYRLKGRQVIEVPLSRHRVMFMVYLTEDPAVTARLDELGWRHYPLE